MRETLEIRKKWVEYWFKRAEEREQQKNTNKTQVRQECGCREDCDNGGDYSGNINPNGKNDYDEMYETLLITGELDLPGEWD
jgi:hypothetical protein